MDDNEQTIEQRPNIHVVSGLERIRVSLVELETAARKLQNQNVADVIKSAHAKVQQVMEHPDVDAIGEHLGREDEVQFDDARGGEPFPSSGT